MKQDDRRFALSKDLIVTEDGFYDKFTWNEAIEAAAKLTEERHNLVKSYPDQIRKLKK